MEEWLIKFAIVVELLMVDVLKLFKRNANLKMSIFIKIVQQLVLKKGKTPANFLEKRFVVSSFLYLTN